ncbi:right-handed parallel beta-helix repeat-containing protein [Mariniflexile litorale]|uniref:Right-handed parallel beta-helix repeat-containing protein n=1 Tax=Mariniflexile litorale TaxID=3045158 RepID=A0AAU7EEA9_9FLAO|nr:right-handed parallel beta-helix repeat-containing protein [Mariniflexile sp. KMM 9835]MDQ8211515.1 right-handed parallel beta-helix repeat-containing protein [Mariniflexile sp. KMM 9835]
MYFLFFLVLPIVSCNNEELLDEPIIEVIEEPIVPEDEDDPDPIASIDTPCDFKLADAVANATVIINCVMDLDGQTISLPAGVTLIYEGGDIINGTINFGSSNTISGELLNSTLVIGGSKPQLKDATFNFNPKRWGIVEGKVSDAVALKNKTILQNTIDQTKLMGVSTFSIGKMDAYFAVGLYGTPKDLANNAIHLDSNFNLVMSDETTLRVQPNDWPFSILIGLYESDNVTITGGNLIGDRWEHDYKVIVSGTINRSSHEWPVLLQISGSENVIVDNVNMSDSTADAFVLGNPNGYRFNGSKYNKNIVVKNCTMTRSRRNNISVTDADDSTIDNCVITDAGLGDKILDSNGNTIHSSAGVLPRTGIDIEPFIGGEDPNNLVYYARVQRLTIKNCTFTGNSNASIIEYAGEDTVIESNFSDAGFGANHGWRTKFINNTLVSAKNREGAGITTGYSEGFYEVKGNSISGFRVGIIANGESGTVSNNTIKDFNVGIQPSNSTNFTFKSNIINGTDGVGISAFNITAGSFMFSDNNITVDKSPVNWNATQSQSSIFDNNKFIARNRGGYVWIKNSNNVNLKNNIITNATILTDGAENFITTNNTLN